MRSIPIVAAFLSSVAFHTPYTISFQSNSISRQFRSRCCRRIAALSTWPFATPVHSAASRSTRSFVDSVSVKVATTAARTPMARFMSSSGDDPTIDQRKVDPPWKVYPSWQYDGLAKEYGDKNVKLIYIVRHAEGWHNVNQEYKSIKNLDARLTTKGTNQCSKLRDELLSLKKEFDVLNNTVDDDAIGDRYKQGLNYLMNGYEKDGDICVLVSPMTRCIQTALLSFDFWLPESSEQQSGKRVPFMGLEALRETVNYNCDRRRRISEVADEYPQIDFSFCRDDEDEIWNSYRTRQRNRTIIEDDRKEEGTHVKKDYLESAELYVVANRGKQALEFLQSLPQSRIVLSTHSAYLRCILNWGQTGGVPRMFEQRLDDREDPTRQDKLFDYCYKDDECSDEAKIEMDRVAFEEYMREDYENAEMRSFCLLVQ